jgi:hypothetical protein
MEEQTPAAVHFDEQTINKLQKFITDNNIPNGIAPNKMHCTLLYSRKHLPGYTKLGDINPPMIGVPTKLEKWPSQPDSEGNVSMCLVMKFDCPELIERHNFLMQEHNATFGFIEYTPHVTLSYDVAGMQVKDLPNIKEAVDNVSIVYEYGDDLNLDWAKTSTSS